MPELSGVLAGTIVFLHENDNTMPIRSKRNIFKVFLISKPEVRIKYAHSARLFHGAFLIRLIMIDKTIKIDLYHGNLFFFSVAIGLYSPSLFQGTSLETNA